MVITRYKPLFSVAVSYELAATGVSTEGLAIAAMAGSEATMFGLKLKPQYKKNTVIVYFEGIETPAGAPVTSEPAITITTDQYFYFGLSFSDKEKIKGLKFHSTNNVAKSVGYPVLYDALIASLGGAATIAAREDVKVISAVFTFTVTKSESGVTGDYASLEIRNEKNNLVDLHIPPVQVNDAGGIPQFAFSVDASALPAGIYEFKVGSFTKKFLLANGMDLTDTVSLIRVLKNDFLEYKKNLNDNSFAQFALQIPKA
jgi:hypothetical protein